MSSTGSVRATLDQQHRVSDQGQTGAPDQHQMGRAPERHVLPEQPVPDVVERKAEQRECAAGEKRDAGDRRVPVARDPDGGATRPALGKHDREEAGAEEAEQPGEDEVVGGVGERSGVAADVDVQGDVPVHPEQGRQQGERGDLRRQRGPDREPGGASGRLGGAPEKAGAPAPVRPAEGEQEGGDRGRGGGRERDLTERGAPGRLRAGRGEGRRGDGEQCDRGAHQCRRCPKKSGRVRLHPHLAVVTCGRSRRPRGQCMGDCYIN